MFFNHRFYHSRTWFERWEFMNKWRSLQQWDKRWVPPHQPTMSWALNANQNPFAAAMNFSPVYVEGLRRERQRTLGTGMEKPMQVTTPFERPLVSAILASDPRRTDQTANLAMFVTENDRESIRFFLDGVATLLEQNDRYRLIGPTGLSPHLGSGLLQDYWDQMPPLHTPYNQPFLPEMVNKILRPIGEQRLYQLPIMPFSPHPAPFQLLPLQPADLAGELLPLLQAACQNRHRFPVPDEVEAQFLLRWLSFAPLFGWVAQQDGRSQGFVLMQPDVGHWVRRLKGGRGLWRRSVLPWAVRRPVTNGRLLFGGVLPAARGQGIGRALLEKSMVTAYQLGWHTMTVGPLDARDTAVHLLTHYNATPKQTYTLHEWNL